MTGEFRDCIEGIVFSQHFFEHHSLWEKYVYLHARARKCMICNLVWHILTGTHTNITLSFLPVGETVIWEIKMSVLIM